uniref:Uncharacterized protein n=1 Tax=Caenorhabditis japonica TaxID=281687 RepID=A0A8R1EF82_CAEJA
MHNRRIACLSPSGAPLSHYCLFVVASIHPSIHPFSHPPNQSARSKWPLAPSPQFNSLEESIRARVFSRLFND